MTLADVYLNRRIAGRHVTPVADISDFEILCHDPKTAESAANLLQPSAITRTAQKRGALDYAGTALEFCLRYQTTVTTSVVVRPVGITEGGSVVPLYDADGNSSFTLATAATDLQDAAGNYLTAPKVVDLDNCPFAMLLVATALVGGGTVDTASDANGPKLLARSR